MPRELQGYTYKLTSKGPDGKPKWGYRIGTGTERRRESGFRTEGEAKRALGKTRDQILAQRTGTLAAGLREVTIADLAGMYLAAHTASKATIRGYTGWLRAATKPLAEGGFGDLPVRQLSPLMVATWRARQPARSAHYYHKALAQMLAWGVKVARVVPENVAGEVPNPRPKRREIAYFETWDDVAAVDDDLPAHLQGLCSFGCGTGLMPEEWIALRWQDVDLEARVLTIERAFSEGELTEYGKTEGRRRRVPLRARVIEVLKARPTPLRQDALVWPGRDGGFVPLRSFRRHDWDPAIVSAGFEEKRTPYAMRHTYAAWSLAASVNPYTLAKRMGTSLAMIDRTYGHLVPDADDYERGLLDAFDARTTGEGEAQEASDG